MPIQSSPMRLHLRARRGFTFVELLMVLVVAAVIMGIAFPKLTPMRESSNMRSARQLVTTYLTTARQAAIRRGADVRYSVTGNSMRVSLASATTGDSVVSPTVNLKDQYGVTISTGLTAVRYNNRGFAYPRLASPQVIRLSRGTRKDSICVTTLGMIAKCGL